MIGTIVYWVGKSLPYLPYIASVSTFIQGSSVAYSCVTWILTNNDKDDSSEESWELTDDDDGRSIFVRIQVH